MDFEEPAVKEAFYSEMEKLDKEKSSVDGDMEGIWQTLKMGVLNATDRVDGWTKGTARQGTTWW